MLNVTNAQYLGSFVDYQLIPNDSLYEIVLLGRSNVGKSSFINKLTKRKNLAYTSKTPGKTQTLNGYYINPQLSIIDVPGYGYAKVSKIKRQEFAYIIEQYLLNRANLLLAIVIIDFKVGPTNDDLMMINYLKTKQIPYLVICSKDDKIAKSKYQKQLQTIIKQLAINTHQLYTYNINDDSINKIITVLENKIS